MKKKLYQGFTLIEMMVVLLIISILMLLFIPNLATQREKVSKQGDLAVVKVVETQIEMYEMEHNETITDAKLKELVSDDQYRIYNEMKDK